MDMNRLNDMLERYGEVCTQKTAGKILNVVPRTISRMMEEGRLRRVGRGVDVRSICEYIENPQEGQLHGQGKEHRRAFHAGGERVPRGGTVWQMVRQSIRRRYHDAGDTLQGQGPHRG